MSSQAHRAEDFLGPQFNDFLFAPVSVDRHGGQLSVVSALARLDLDAWAEAANLARLPGDAAIAKLCLLLTKVTEFPQTAKETQKIAVRLVALLPGHGPVRIPTSAPRASSQRTAGMGLVPSIPVVIVALVMGAVVLLAGTQLGARAGSPPPVAAAPAPLVNVQP
jgi:hypothetical protein